MQYAVHNAKGFATTPTMNQNKIKLQVVFIISILLAVFIFSKNSQGSKPTPLLEAQAAEYIYDEQTDTLVVHSTLENKLTILDLDTKEKLLEVDASTPIAFYIPGKYVSLNQEAYYDLRSRQELPVTTAQTLEYTDSKDELRTRLEHAAAAGTEMYSVRHQNFNAFFIRDGNQASYYEAYSEASDFPQYAQMISLPTSIYSASSAEVGLTEVTDGMKVSGPEGYLLEVVDTSREFMGGGSRSQTWNITKNGTQFALMKLGGKNLPTYILAYPQNRKEVFILGHFGVSHVAFP